MLIKLCFNNETHLISKLPKSYQDLISFIRGSFQDKLPDHIDIHYKDCDGDNVMLASDQDLEAMFAIEGNTDHTLKIIISAAISPSLDTSNIIIEKEKPMVMVSDVIQKMDTLKVSDPAPSITVKNFEPFKAVESCNTTKTEPFVLKKEASTTTIQEKQICKKCMGSGFNIKKKKACKRCEGLGVVEKKEDACRKCCGSGFNTLKGKPCNRCDGKGKRMSFERKGSRCQEWKEKRLQKIKTLIDEQVNLSIDKLREELNLKKSREEFLQQKPNTQAEIRKKVHSEGSGNAIHERYTCDGCGTTPIVGTRYKCSVCRDFDYCESCESKIEHEHAFLKIKYPKQAPKMIFTALEQLPQQILSFFKGPEKKPQEECKGTNTEEEPKEQHIYKELDLSFSEGIYEEFPKIFEKKEFKPVEKKENLINFEVNKLKILPELILESTNFVFVSFILKNAGKISWPENLRLENMSKSLKCDSLLLPALSPNEEISLTLVVENPKLVGKHQMIMEMTNETKTFIKELTFEFEVQGVPMKNERKEEKKEEKMPERKPEEKKVEKVVLSKAESLKEIFGGEVADFIDICEKFKDVPIDNLAEQVLNDRLLMEKFSKMEFKN
jgi:hypothetical protein